MSSSSSTAENETTCRDIDLVGGMRKDEAGYDSILLIAIVYLLKLCLCGARWTRWIVYSHGAV